MPRKKHCNCENSLIAYMPKYGTYAPPARMLRRFTLPATVHDEANCRVWQRRFYDMNIWSEKKQLEKLDYIHNNPVTRGLVGSPGDWPWSSWRFYFMEDTSLITMDRVE